MTVRHFPQVTLTIDGKTVPTDSISIGSDSPLDLHIPPNVGNFPGADAQANLALAAPVGWRPEVPWSPTFRARPGMSATVDIDGTRVFTGFVDDAGVSLAAGDVNASMVDPLSNVDRQFSAPATLRRLAPRPGSSQEVPPGASMLYYLVAAFEKLGAHPSIRIASRTDLYVPNCGTGHPLRGEINLLTQRDTGDSAVVPWVQPEFVPMSGGRIGVKNVWQDYTTRPRGSSDPTVGSWHVSIEIDPAQYEDTSYVRIRSMGDESGFGVWFTGPNTLRVCTWDAAGTRYDATYVDQGQTLTDVPFNANTERILFVYNVVTNQLQCATQDAAWLTSIYPFDFTPNPSGIPTLTLADKRVRVRATGRCAFGTLAVMSRATAIAAQDNEMFAAPRGLKFDLNAAWIARWSIDGHPPVEGENAVAFITEQVAKRRAFLHTDDNGTVHLGDPSGWPVLPVSHVITDAAVGGDIDLDDIQVQLARRQRFSRVRVNGTSVAGDTGWGPGMKPNRIYDAPGKEITLEADSDPVELWFEPQDGTFWAEPPDLALRYAGEPVSEPWHLPDDFARGRGTWGGGYVRNKVNTEYGHRWATPTDVIYTLEQVTPSKVKVTITPGPGLGSDEEYINLPHPTSTSLPEQNPARLAQHLPVLRGPAVGTYGEVTGVSDDIPYNVEDWGEYDEYVHDAGLVVQYSSRARILAQVMSDSHEDDFGKVTIHCAFNPSVKVGQRVQVKPTSRSDVTLDGVVTGIPNRDVSAGSAPSMTLTLWVHRVDVHSITYDERAALMRAQADEDGDGTTYAADRARNAGLTYAQERVLASLSRSENLAPPLTSVDNWRAIGDLAAVTPGGVPAIRCLRASGSGVIYMDPAVNFQAPVGTRFYLSVDVRVTDPIPMRLRFMAYDGATGAANSPTVTQVATDGWVTYGLLTTIGGDPNGYLRALVYPNTSSHPEGQGFWVRNYQVRTYT